MYDYAHISRGAEHYLASVCDHGCALNVTLTSHLQKRCVYRAELYMERQLKWILLTSLLLELTTQHCPLQGMDCNGLLNFQSVLLECNKHSYQSALQREHRCTADFPQTAQVGCSNISCNPIQNWLYNANESQFQTTSPYK